jgi:4-amino-4-deoxy-L-arabinose transferase-like glycosyltransferase
MCFSFCLTVNIKNMSGTEGTAVWVGTASGVALGILCNYKYPQKYWIPWVFVICGGTGLGLFGGFVANES